MTETKKRGISGFALKMTAVITMLIDHTAATILERYLETQSFDWWGDTTSGWVILYYAMRLIGRLAFPIYCYLLVEGFGYTHSVKKYALRLALFAVISEVPFDMAFNRSFMDWSYNSVFLTLLIGLLTIWGMDESGKRFSKKVAVAESVMSVEGAVNAESDRDAGVAASIETVTKPTAVSVILEIVIAVAGMAAANLLSTDYGAGGVLTIIVIYLFRKRKMLSTTLGVVTLGLTCGIMEFFALIDLPLFYVYNGTRGRQMKYFFYIFYPVHLFILSMICYFLGYGI